MKDWAGKGVGLRGWRGLWAVAVAMVLVMLAALAGMGATDEPADDPVVFVTENLTAEAVSTEITVMEQGLLDRIHGAAGTIDGALYDFERVSVRDALIAARGRGVVVRIVTDDEARANPSYAPHFAALEAAGITVVDDQDDSRIMHDKYFIFDDQTVWTGSTNVSDNDLTLNHNNSIVFVGGAVTDAFQHDFEQMVAGTFGSAKGPSPVTNLTYKGFPLEVYFSPQDGAMAQVISEVAAAQTSVDFAIFFFTEDGLRDALIAAHQRGVVIRGLWDALGAGNGSSDDEALCAAGIPIKIENTFGKMHHKLMVIDGAGAAPRVITGSLNWTGAADVRNSENTVIVHDPVTTQRYATAFQTMWAGISAPPCGMGETPAAALYLPLVVRGEETGTPTPAPADVRLARITYNPAGDDVAGERVALRNGGGTAAVMTGWQLRDEANARYTFPAFTLAPGATVTVWVKSGTDGATELFWGLARAVWNNDGDTATLSDESGRVMDVCSYTGGGTEAGCE